MSILAERPGHFDKVIMIGSFNPDSLDYRINSHKLRTQLKWFAEKYGINLQLIDQVSKEELRKIYNTAGFLVSNSINEGCHAVVQEAMSCGTKVLSADWMGASGIYPEEVIYHTSLEFWNIVDYYTKMDLRKWIIDNHSCEVILPQLDRVIEEAAGD